MPFLCIGALFIRLDSLTCWLEIASRSGKWFPIFLKPTPEREQYMTISPNQTFVPLSIKRLDEAHAFLRDQTEDRVEENHQDFFGIRSADGIWRAPLPVNTEWVDPESAIIERIDAERGDLAIEDELDRLNDVKLALEESLVNPHFDKDGDETPLTRVNGFRARNNGQRVGMRRSAGIMFQKFSRRPQGWKDRSRVRYQHLRHPRRIERNVMVAEA